ncbi:hypothetical protein [Natronoglomus mannanivorans]|uniref:Uncharacterized protein n=1 Tax=Natronoglomus mannanivorans TaxID=2979990 RepID=A0AAP2Z2S5_9EURY|nr:hypothetical protein [Halobacteria archaeon AArc-xg1-1]
MHARRAPGEDRRATRRARGGRRTIAEHIVDTHESIDDRLENVEERLDRAERDIDIVDGGY